MSIIISCDSCILRDTAACADCIVTHVLSPAPVEQFHFDDEEWRVVTLLARAGLVPTLMHREALAPDPFAAG